MHFKLQVLHIFLGRKLFVTFLNFKHNKYKLIFYIYLGLKVGVRYSSKIWSTLQHSLIYVGTEK